MASEIQLLTWCDVHLQEKDERVPGAEYVVALGHGGARAVPLVVDLCPDCTGPLATVEELLAAYGRKPSSNGTTSTPRKPKAAAPAPARTVPRDSTVCPRCGHEAANRKALGAHAKNAHDGIILAELEGDAKGLTCLLCQPHKDFQSRAAVAIHVGRGQHVG